MSAGRALEHELLADIEARMVAGLPAGTASTAGGAHAAVLVATPAAVQAWATALGLEVRVEVRGTPEQAPVRHTSARGVLLGWPLTVAAIEETVDVVSPRPIPPGRPL